MSELALDLPSRAPALFRAMSWSENGRAALPHYGLSPQSELELLRLSENATYRVRDPQTGALTILRLARPGYRAGAEIESELAWIDAIRRDGVAATPAVIPTLDGRALSRFSDGEGNEQHAVLFEHIDGDMLEDVELAGAFVELGAIAARLHAHSRSWRPPSGFSRPVWDVETNMGVDGLWGYWRDNKFVGQTESAILGAADAKVRAELAAYGAPADRYGLIHGDMRLANVMLDGRGLHLIDFDDCGYSWHLYELACSLSFIEAHPDAAALASAWLDGYQRTTRLTAADLAVAPALVMMRRLLLIGWFSTHGHTPEARDMDARYVPDSIDIAEAYLKDAYLRARPAG